MVDKVDEMQRRIKVLVIDDEPAIRRLVMLVLAEEGYDAVSAASGPEGIALAANDLPDIVLLDLMMPEVDGDETLRRLRRLPGGGAIPVLIMSAAADMARQVHGAQDVLVKPFNLSDLVRAVERILRISAGNAVAG